MNGAGLLVVSLTVVNFAFWSHLGVHSARNVTRIMKQRKFSRRNDQEAMNLHKRE